MSRRQKFETMVAAAEAFNSQEVPVMPHFAYLRHASHLSHAEAVKKASQELAAKGRVLAEGEFEFAAQPLLNTSHSSCDGDRNGLSASLCVEEFLSAALRHSFSHNVLAAGASSSTTSSPVDSLRYHSIKRLSLLQCQLFRGTATLLGKPQSSGSPYPPDAEAEHLLRQRALGALTACWPLLHPSAAESGNEGDPKRSDSGIYAWSAPDRYAGVWDPTLGCVVVRWHDRRAGKLLQRALSAVASAVRVSLLPDVFAVPPSVTCAHHGELLTVLWLPSLCASEPLDVADERSRLCRPAVQLLSGLLRGSHHLDDRGSSSNTSGRDDAAASAPGPPLVDVYPGSPCTYWMLPSAEFLRVARVVPALPGSYLPASLQPCGSVVRQSPVARSVHRMVDLLMRRIVSQTPVPPDRGGFLHSTFHLHGARMRSLLEVRRVLLEQSAIEDRGSPTFERVCRIKKDVETLLLSEAVARVLKCLVLQRQKHVDLLRQLLQAHFDGTGRSNVDVEATALRKSDSSSPRSHAGSFARKHGGCASSIASVLAALGKEIAAGGREGAESQNIVDALCSSVASRSALVLHLFINANDFVIDVVGPKLVEKFACTSATTVDLKRDVAVADVTCVLRYLLGLDEFFAESLRSTHLQHEPRQPTQGPAPVAVDGKSGTLAPGTNLVVDTESVSVLWCFCYGAAGVERVYLPHYEFETVRGGGGAARQSESLTNVDTNESLTAAVTELPNERWATNSASTVLALTLSLAANMHGVTTFSSEASLARRIPRRPEHAAASPEGLPSSDSSNELFITALLDVARLTFEAVDTDPRPDATAPVLPFLRMCFLQKRLSPSDHGLSFLAENPVVDVADADLVWVAEHLCRLIEMHAASASTQLALHSPVPPERTRGTATLQRSLANMLVVVLVRGSAGYRALGKTQSRDLETSKAPLPEAISHNLGVPFLTPKSYLSQLVWKHSELFSTTFPEDVDTGWLSLGRHCVIIAAAAVVGRLNADVSSSSATTTTSPPPIATSSLTASLATLLRNAWWGVATTAGQCADKSGEPTASSEGWWSSCWGLLTSATFLIHHDSISGAATGLMRQEDPLSWIIGCVVLPAAVVESRVVLRWDSSFDFSWITKVGRECCRRHCAQLLRCHGACDERPAEAHRPCAPPPEVSHWLALLRSDMSSSREWLLLLQSAAFYGKPLRPKEQLSLHHAVTAQLTRSVGRQRSGGVPPPAAMRLAHQEAVTTTAQLLDRVALVVRQAASYWLAALAPETTAASSTAVDATRRRNPSFTSTGLCCCSEACWSLRVSPSAHQRRDSAQEAAVPAPGPRKDNAPTNTAGPVAAPVRLPPLLLQHRSSTLKHPQAPRSGEVQTDRSHHRSWRRRHRNLLVEPVAHQPTTTTAPGGSGEKWSVYLNPQRRRYLEPRGHSTEDILAAAALVLLPPYSSRLLPAIRHVPPAPGRRPSDGADANVSRHNPLPPLDG